MFFVQRMIFGSYIIIFCILIQTIMCSAVCDGTFFPLLLKEMSAVVTFFNKQAQTLLDRHLASGCSKCFIWLEDRFLGNQITLIQECENLVTYASINAIAMRRILKKYDKVVRRVMNIYFIYLDCLVLLSACILITDSLF